MGIFKFTNDNKRYHTLHYYNMQKFGERVYKAPINSGFTCPNIDGKKGRGGCIYCDGGSGYFTDSSNFSTEEQLKHQIALIHAKHPNSKINAYFQSYSNTYADVGTLKKHFEPIFDFSEVMALSIATRCDCLEDDIMLYLSDLSKRIDLTVELGLQTVNDKTAEIIGRGHSFREFEEGFCKLRRQGIRTVVHVINGLPEERIDNMLETAEVLGKMKPDGVKIHLLHVIKGTKLEEYYNSGKYIPLTKEEYVEITVKQLELLPPETVIERITGDGDKKKLIAPMWSADKISVLGAIDKLQSDLDTYQGRLF
ncbi:MAG: TIGR01212 family radical SAM protein [Firmicutes bacterium]|nr:TIGR01212 family radical SAM protein [[Eubacterium] siraeum]MCM1487090.1 TIGR01212 family radical SAM protein [Bacillota bacterium]